MGNYFSQGTGIVTMNIQVYYSENKLRNMVKKTKTQCTV